MPLPDDPQTPWPPHGWSPQFAKIREHAAWYSGDPEQLQGYYGGADARLATSTGWFRRFWRRVGSSGDPGRSGGNLRGLHVPIAGDIATTSADLIFSEAPGFTIPEASGGEVRTDAEGEAPEDQGDRATSTSEAVAAQDRLNDLIEEMGIHNTLLEAAETSAALGGVYLRPTWDQAVIDRPILQVIHPDHAVPEFRFGMLVAVTFWRTFIAEQGSSRIYRHLERHEDGVILHAMYEGGPDRLGNRIPLTEHPETQALAESLSDGDEITLPGELKGILVRYVPNVLPNRLFRGSPMGRSDLQGCEGMMDALDETWTSWVRDIRLGAARLIVADEYLDKGGIGWGPGGDLQRFTQGGGQFNIDQEVFTPLAMDPASREGGGIEEVQFAIRTTEHQVAALQLVREIVTKAGYAPQSFNPEHEGTAESGTAIRLRERKSFITKAKKERYFRTPLEETLELLLYLDRVVWQRPTPVLRPRVAFQDSVAPELGELAQTASLLRAAEAASVEVRVRTVHPEWGDEEVAGEVTKIQSEAAVAVPSPLGDMP
jgi:hypothetical protein